MDSLDIQVVDSLTVNLNQEDYSTEGLVLNNVDVYIEDEQLLFETALTQDSINLYTRETPDTIIFDAKEITDGISKLESLIEKTSKESTLTSGVNELKTAIENIDLSSVESKVDEVKQAVENIDLSPIESKVEEGVNTLSSKIDNIDLSAVENKVQEESAAIQNKLDNLNVEVDLSNVAKQGENQEATNSKIYEAVKAIESWSAKYDSTTGNLTIENVNITIE